MSEFLFKDISDFFSKIEKDIKITLNKRGNDEHNMAILGDKHGLLRSYCKRMTDYMPYMTKEARHQAMLTIQNLNAQLAVKK